MAEEIQKTEEEWKSELTPEQYKVLRKKGTEAPFSGEYVHAKDEGMYKCAACGAELFSSDTKFDSHSGWPSFTEPVNLANVRLEEDRSHGMVRTEVICKKCGGHLGHVFDDLPRHLRVKAGGPKEAGGQRYCINSCALNLEKK